MLTQALVPVMVDVFIDASLFAFFLAVVEKIAKILLNAFKKGEIVV